jgi:hypothetical protein
MFLKIFVVCVTLILCGTNALKCEYDFSNTSMCSVIKSESGTECPDLCLHGDEMNDTCVGCGVDCTHGAYGQCGWNSSSITSDVGDFSFSFTSYRTGEKCGTGDAPGRIFAISADSTCSGSDFLVAQRECDLLIRSGLMQTETECDKNTFIIPRCMCGEYIDTDGDQRETVALSVEVVYTDDIGVMSVTVSTADLVKVHTYHKSFEVHMVHGWRGYQMTVCDDVTLDKNWCGILSHACISTGTSTRCNLERDEDLVKWLSTLFTHKTECSPGQHREKEDILTVQFGSISVMPHREFVSKWETESYQDSGFPMKSLIAIVTVSCLAVTAFVGCLLCSRKRKS